MTIRWTELEFLSFPREWDIGYIKSFARSKGQVYTLGWGLHPHPYHGQGCNPVVSPKSALCFNELVTQHTINVHGLPLAKLVTKLGSRTGTVEESYECIRFLLLIGISSFALRTSSIETSFLTVKRVRLSYLTNIKTMTLPYPNLGDTNKFNPCANWCII